MRHLLLSLLLVMQLSLAAQQSPDEPIRFACEATKAACIEAGWDTNGDGELSYSEAAAVTCLPEECFNERQSIPSFDELRYFTGVRSIGFRAFGDAHNITSMTLPPNVEKIDDKAFWSVIVLTRLTLPPSLRNMGIACFYHCEKLQDITIPELVDTVPYRAFMWCQALLTVTLKEGVQHIDKDAFGFCISLKELALPSTLKSIGPHAFTNCRKINIITCYATNPPAIGIKAFEPRVTENATLFVPQGSLNAYRNAAGWKDFRYISELF